MFENRFYLLTEKILAMNGNNCIFLLNCSWVDAFIIEFQALYSCIVVICAIQALEALNENVLGDQVICFEVYAYILINCGRKLANNVAFKACGPTHIIFNKYSFIQAVKTQKTQKFIFNVLNSSKMQYQ